MTHTNDRELLATTIERFVRGTAGPYEWDDIVCVPFEDPELEAIRQEAESVDTAFPPSRPTEYCSDKGAAYLLKLVARLRDGA
jgi:hypothetical protein